MKRIILVMFFSCQFIAFAQTDTIQGVGLLTPTIDEATTTGYYIPKDMFDCFKELENMLPDDISDSLKWMDVRTARRKYKEVIQWMTKNWNMWDTSRIVKYFHKFGFTQPATISHGIFSSYWNYLNDKPIRIEIKPDYYSIGNNLFLHVTDEIIFPKKRPNPKGTIINTDSTPQFIFMGRKFTLIDSLYDPIIELLKQNMFAPSDSLWYIWWSKVVKFGDGVEGLPSFLTEDEFEAKYSNDNSYNADFILILEDNSKGTIKQIIRSNSFNDEFIEYLNSKRHLGFYLVRMRKVAHFD